jgi:hypothetical protein
MERGAAIVGLAEKYLSIGKPNEIFAAMIKNFSAAFDHARTSRGDQGIGGGLCFVIGNGRGTRRHNVLGQSLALLDVEHHEPFEKRNARRIAAFNGSKL